MKSWKTKGGFEIIRVLEGRSNCFLITNQEKSILIDTGRKNNWTELVNNLAALKINDISLLILTHTHYDHAENAAQIKERFQPPILVHKSESDYLKSGDSPIPQGSNIVTRVLVDTFGKQVQRKVRYAVVAADLLIEDQHDLGPLGFNACVIHSPGHTIGSVSIIVDNEVAIVGDAMFGVFKNSIFPPFVNDTKAIMISWKKLLDTGCKIYLPSHGREIARELLDKEYARYQKKFAQ